MNNLGTNSVLSWCVLDASPRQNNFSGGAVNVKKKTLEEQAAKVPRQNITTRKPQVLQAFQVMIIRNLTNKIAVTPELNCEIPSINVEQLGTKKCNVILIARHERTSTMGIFQCRSINHARKWTFMRKFGLNSCYNLTFFAFIRLEAM